MMKYLKIYEDFEIEEETEKEVSNYTIDDVLNGEIFRDDNSMDDESYIDENGIIHIKNWLRY